MMSVSKHEAEAALSQIDSVTRRGMALRSYRHAGPILMVWGLIWGLGYLGMAKVAPEYWGWMWGGLDVVGVVGTLVLSSRFKPVDGGLPGQAWRSSLGMAACVAFILAIVAVFPKTELLPYIALPGLFVGFLYTVMGVVMAAWRYALIGAVVFLATLLGYYAWPQYLAEWLALVGGGGLFLSGLWLRSA